MSISRIFACLSGLLVLANCSVASEQTPTVSSRAPETQAESADKKALACLAEAIYFEARGTGREGRQAVAHVVVNRAENPEFPDSVCGVVTDGCQFSYRCDGKADALANAAARERALGTAEAVLTGEVGDVTEGALFFHADSASPGWFSTRPRVGTFGGNVFYR